MTTTCRRTDRHVGAEGAHKVDLELDRIRVLVDPDQRCAFVHLGAGIARAIQEQRIELGATDDGRVHAAAPWQWQLDDACRRRSHPRGIDGLP